MIYFSPTGTTKKIISAIANGTKIQTLEFINITHLKVREKPLPVITSDVVIIGIPVYGMRIPNILKSPLRTLIGTGQPIVLVTVYGNIGPGIALRELGVLVEKRGFHVIAAASFIGEHSLSHHNLPIAQGRPDDKDLVKAQEFGNKIVEKLKEYHNIDKILKPEIRGTISFIERISPKNSAKLITKQPAVDINLCKRCGVCIEVCPIAAIDIKTLKINEKICFRCFACVKHCPENARNIVIKKKLFMMRILKNRSKNRRIPVISL